MYDIVKKIVFGIVIIKYSKICICVPQMFHSLQFKLSHLKLSAILIHIIKTISYLNYYLKQKRI